MSKRLIICCDGTWNTAQQPSPTNIKKICDAIATKDHAGTKQDPYYIPGVGVKRWEHLRGGAFGFGLSRNVKDAYRIIVQHFEPGDELFLFGFSRGAYTARSTAGLIYNVGILRPEHADRLDDAYELYRSRGAPPDSPEARSFRNSYSHPDETRRIRFIGVYDTVGALGIPLSPARWVNFINRRWQFHDLKLNRAVEAAFQALAIDEKRGPFTPAIWELCADAVGQQVEQVWFAGDHCDIGGGHPETGLSDITLQWMISQAGSCGLTFDASQSGSHPLDPMTKPLHDSRRLLYKLLPSAERDIGVKDPAHESAASSAVQRHKTDPPAYSPPRLVAYLRGPHHETQV
jgi:uncharacterized protein (DUF2235 family)